MEPSATGANSAAPMTSANNQNAQLNSVSPDPSTSPTPVATPSSSLSSSMPNMVEALAGLPKSVKPVESPKTQPTIPVPVSSTPVPASTQPLPVQVETPSPLTTDSKADQSVQADSPVPAVNVVAEVSNSIFDPQVLNAVKEAAPGASEPVETESTEQTAPTSTQVSTSIQEPHPLGNNSSGQQTISEGARIQSSAQTQETPSPTTPQPSSLPDSLEEKKDSLIPESTPAPASETTTSDTSEVIPTSTMNKPLPAPIISGGGLDSDFVPAPVPVRKSTSEAHEVVDPTKAPLWMVLVFILLLLAVFGVFGYLGYRVLTDEPGTGNNNQNNSQNNNQNNSQNNNNSDLAKGATIDIGTGSEKITFFVLGGDSLTLAASEVGKVKTRVLSDPNTSTNKITFVADSSITLSQYETYVVAFKSADLVRNDPMLGNLYRVAVEDSNQKVRHYYANADIKQSGKCDIGETELNAPCGLVNLVPNESIKAVVIVYCEGTLAFCQQYGDKIEYATD